MSEERRGNWIYIGPSIPPLGLQKHTLYRSSELPPALKLISASKPAVRALYVDVNELVAARYRLATAGSLEHTANQEMLGISKITPR